MLTFLLALLLQNHAAGEEAMPESGRDVIRLRKEVHHWKEMLHLKQMELEYTKLEVENRKMFIDALQKRIEILQKELSDLKVNKK